MILNVYLFKIKYFNFKIKINLNFICVNKLNFNY